MNEPDPHGSPGILDWSQNHAEIAWPPPESDVKATITHYIIEQEEQRLFLFGRIKKVLLWIRLVGHFVGCANALCIIGLLTSWQYVPPDNRKYMTHATINRLDNFAVHS